MPSLNMDYIKQKQEEIRQRDERKGSKGGDGENGGGKGPPLFLKIPEGMMEFRALPPWSPAGLLAKEIHTHFQLPPNNATVECPALSFPGQKLVCEVHGVLDEFAPHLNVQRQRASFSPRINVYIPDSPVNRANPGVADRIGLVQILNFTGGCFKQLVQMISNPSIGDVTDPWNGITLSLTKTKGATWQVTKYTLITLPRPGPIHPDKAKTEEIIKKIPDLDKIFSPPDDAKRVKNAEIAAAMRKHYAGLVGRPVIQNSQSASSSPQQPAPKPAAAPPAGGSKVVPTASSNPSEKPVCFGHAEAYVATHPICATCIWEVPCAQSIKAKAGK